MKREILSLNKWFTVVVAANFDTDSNKSFDDLFDKEKSFGSKTFENPFINKTVSHSARVNVPGKKECQH